jgi:hypothetical protein
MKKFLLFFVCFVLFGTIANPVNGSMGDLLTIQTPDSNRINQNQAQVWISPATTDIQVGQSFTVAIMLDTHNKASRGAWAGLQYNPKLLHANWIKEGDFYRSWARSHNASTVLFPAPFIINRIGLITAGQVVIRGGKTDGPAGSGSLFVIQFTALAAGKAPLHLTNVAVTGTNRHLLTANKTNAMVKITSAVQTPEPTPIGKTPTTTATRTVPQATFTQTNTVQPTRVNTGTNTPTSTPRPTITSTRVNTVTSTPRPTATPTRVNTATSTLRPTATPTQRFTPTSTLRPTTVPSRTYTPTVKATETATQPGYPYPGSETETPGYPYP